MPNDEIADRLQAALAGLDALRPAIGAGEPWPLAERFDHAPEAAWGPPEVLAHLSEMVGYWDGELTRIGTSGAPEPVPFGRVATDATRLGVIERDRRLPIASLYADIERKAEAFLDRWGSWTPAERDRVGLHPIRGEFTVAAGAERFIVSHLEEHVAQLEAILGVASTGG